MAGPALSGVSATADLVIAADRDLERGQDSFRALDPTDGTERWRLAYAAPGELDFTSAPRAAPVIDDRRIYVLGAFGHLHALDRETGRVLWARNLREDFNAELAIWGYASTPLRIDDLLIVNPGAPDASVAALEAATGRTVWTAPGAGAAYASFIEAAPGGVRQVIGYDADSLGGWDPATGRRLWRLVMPEEGDFNVPTPILLGDRLLLATENNGTRLYAFDARGIIQPAPVAANPALAPDTATPVVVDGLVFGCGDALYCLDAGEGLRTRWKADERGFADFCSLIAGNGRVLVTTHEGRLILFDADAAGYRKRAEYRIAPEDTDSWSHPALVGDRFYFRTMEALYAYRLETRPGDGP